jgi:FRG domain
VLLVSALNRAKLNFEQGQRMATEVSVNTWEECEKKIQNIEERHGSKQPYFRGHSNSNWELLSTLERRSQNMTIAKYYELMDRISPEIEAFTERGLKLPDLEKIHTFGATEVDLMRLLATGCSSMAYLRHHGFPSPLLDWTASPYVAAYFAFAPHTNAECVAIYAYVERPMGLKFYGEGWPQITAVERIVGAHPRHFRQQSRYTVCAKFEERRHWAFVRHQEAFELPEAKEQDFLWKISVPASERVKVLSLLDRYNLNAYSLFGSEESLMDTLAFRHFDVKP